MRNRLHKFFLREAVFKGLLKMKLDVLDTVQRNQACHGNQASVALRESGTFPYIAEKQVFRTFLILTSFENDVVASFLR